MSFLLACGTGTSPRRTDVPVPGDRVADVLSPGTEVSGVERIDVSGRVVCPGFVDIHTHSDLTLLSNPLAHSKVRQGVTTEVVGNRELVHPPPRAAHDDELRVPDFVRTDTLTDCGVLAPGGLADIVVLDMDRLADRATFTLRQRFPAYIEVMFVAGTMVVAAGEHTGARPGGVVRAATRTER